MPRTPSLFGVVGCILLVFGGVAYAITRSFSPYVLLHTLFGSFALILYVAASYENLQTFLGQRSTKYGANAVLYSLIFVAVFFLLNYLAVRHHYRLDLTEAQIYSLSPQSKKIVGGLEKEVEIHAFVEGGDDAEVKELLDSYSYASPKVKYRMVDPDRQPELAERFGISAYRTLHLQYGDRDSKVTKISEEEITNAIIKVTRQERKTVYFVEGHGEPDTEDGQNAQGYGQVKAALENENYQVQKLLLPSVEKVPEDCALLVVAGPEKPLFDHEVKAIEEYLKRGGHALFLLKPRSSPELVTLLTHWGVKVGNDVIVDQVIRLFQGPALGLEPIADTYGVHPITENFTQRTIFSLARSVEADTAKNGLQATALVKTSPNSWAETDLQGVFDRGQAALDAAADHQGPVSLAVAVTARLKEMGFDHDGEARLVVFGSATFANNKYLNSLYNRDLFLNTVGWLVGEEELIAIRPRSVRASRAQFTQPEGTAIFYLSVLILPELLLVTGLAVWWRRR